MAKIYLIINVKNNKKYVGQTQRCVAQRFCQHIDAAYREQSKKRRNEFYLDLKNSGENVFNDFKCQILEECPDKEKLQREVFYISKILPEYNENYKAEYIKSISDKIIKEYSEGYNITEIRKKYKCRHQLISPIIHAALKEGKIAKHNSDKQKKKVYLFDDNGELKQEWLCAGVCGKELKIDRSHIRSCALKNSKENILYFSAQGYHFKYDKETPKDMFEIKRISDDKIIRFKSKNAFLNYFKSEFPDKKIIYSSLVRDRKTVYGYEIKKLH